MRTTRLLGAFAAATIAAIAPLSATIAAAEETTGVGRGTVSSTLLQVDVGEAGEVLSVRLLSDEGTSTIDPADGAPSSSTSLTPFSITSGAVPALNVTAPSVGTSSTGAEDATSESVTLPGAPTLTGTLTASLSSVVDAVGARSGLEANLADLGVAGGLLSVPSATVSLGTSALGSSASGNRTISIPSIEVLNLGAVLEGLGLTLADLPLDDLLGLLGTLGLTLPDVTDPAAVIDAVDGAIDELQGETGALTDELCASVDDALGTVGGLVGLGQVSDAVDDIVEGVTGGSTPTTPVTTPVTTPPVTLPLTAQALPVSCDSVTGTVEDLVDDLQALVGGLVDGLLQTLDDTSLLSVQGIEVGIVADAKSSVDSSVAAVTGTIGSVKVGALAVPGLSGLDLTAAADVLAAAGDTVSAAVGSVLGVVNAQLADMVDVDVLQITETVGADGDYTNATAAVTALTATLTPPALLTGALAVTDTASGVLAEVGAAVPALAPLMSDLGVTLGGLDVLAAPSTITVGRLSSSSAFRPASASVPGGGTPSGELPRTGSDAAVPAMAAVLVAGVALGIRRFIATVTA